MNRHAATFKYPTIDAQANAARQARVTVLRGTVPGNGPQRREKDMQTVVGAAHGRQIAGPRGKV